VPTLAPSHHVASKPTTEDAKDTTPPETAPIENPGPADQPEDVTARSFVTVGDDDQSQLLSVLVSADALARIAALAEAPPSRTDPAAQVAELQAMLRAFHGVHATGPVGPPAQAYQANQLARRYREKLDAEVAAHRTTRDQLEDLGLFTDTETQRAEEERARADHLAALDNTNRAILSRWACLSPAAGVPSDGGSGIKIPDPPKFSRGRPQYRVFRAKLQEKLAGDAAKFRDASHRLAYAMGFLEEEAYTIAQSLREGGIITDTDGLLAHLDGTYEDPDRKGTAERELRTLRQGTADFTAHYARFQALMAVLGWAGDAKLSAFRQTLSYELRDALAHTITPLDETFEGYVHRAKGLDGQLRQFAAETRGYGRQNPRASAPGRPRETTPGPAGSGGTVPPSGPRGPLSEEERARRMAEQLCLYCGDADHRARDCPNRPPNARPTYQRPGRVRAAAARTATVTEVVDESDLSGKVPA
jgi:hypothetical protein